MPIRIPRRPEDWLGDADTETLTAWLEEMRTRSREGRSMSARDRGAAAESASAHASKRLELGSSEAPKRDGPRR